MLSFRWSLLKEDEILLSGQFLFFAHASPLFLSGAPGSFCIFLIIIFNLIWFFFSFFYFLQIFPYAEKCKNNKLTRTYSLARVNLIVSKVVSFSQGWPEGPLFNNYYTCYIIKEWFFLILIIFRWLYFIIQFGWALNYLAYEPRCRVNWCSLRSRARDITISIVIINPQTGNEAGMWMTRRDGPENLRILKKRQLRSGDWTIEAESWVLYHWGMELDLGHWRWNWVFRISADRDLRHYKMRCTLGMVIIVRIVSLSLCRKSKVKKLINPFVPEMTESRLLSPVFSYLYITKLYNTPRCREGRYSHPG